VLVRNLQENKSINAAKFGNNFSTHLYARRGGVLVVATIIGPR